MLVKPTRNNNNTETIIDSQQQIGKTNGEGEIIYIEREGEKTNHQKRFHNNDNKNHHSIITIVANKDSTWIHATDLRFFCDFVNFLFFCIYSRSYLLFNCES